MRWAVEGAGILDVYRKDGSGNQHDFMQGAAARVSVACRCVHAPHACVYATVCVTCDLSVHGRQGKALVSGRWVATSHRGTLGSYKTVA